MDREELFILATSTTNTPSEASEKSSAFKKPFSKSRKIKTTTIEQQAHFGLPRHFHGKIDTYFKSRHWKSLRFKMEVFETNYQRRDSRHFPILDKSTYSNFSIPNSRNNGFQSVSSLFKITSILFN